MTDSKDAPRDGAEPAEDRASPERETGATISLRLKLGLLAAALATIPLAVVGLLLIDVNEEAVTILSRELQLAVVDDLARTIDQEFIEAQDGLDAVGRVLTNADLTAEVTVPIALATVESSEAIDHVVIFGVDGQQIDTIREEAVREISVPEILSDELREEALRFNRATGPAEIHDGGPRVPLVVPLRAGD